LKRSLILLLVFVFIDVLSFSLILPLLPFYAETFDATPTAVGLLLGVLLMAWLIPYIWRRVLFAPDVACPAEVQYA
jgi:MFS family permease